MKQTVLTLLVACCLATLVPTTTSAKKEVVQKMYMFGMAASFNDSIVHFTDIQDVDSAWINSKNKFLLGRDSYSYQLRVHLSDQLQMPHRTCIVIYNQNREKLEKQYQKMLRLYTVPKKGSQRFDVRMVESGTFHFEAIDMSDAPDEEEAPAKKSKKSKKPGKPGKPAKPGNPEKPGMPEKPGEPSPATP